MKLTKIDLPVSEKLKEIALMRLEAKADPTTMSQEALDTTRPLAKEVKKKLSLSLLQSYHIYIPSYF